MMPALVGGASETLSDEQRITLAAELLAQCPPGEFADVLQGMASALGLENYHHLADINVILNDDNLLAGLQETIETRNVNNGVLISVKPPAEEATGDDEEKGKDESIPLILSEYNRLADGNFVEQESGLVVRINPFNLEVEELISGTKCEDPLRLELCSALRRYLRESLPKGNFMVHYDADKQLYATVIVGEKFQLHNMRNGQWYSAWTYAKEEGQVKGKIRVMVHYFEDGNVQLSSDREVSFAFDSPSSGAHGDDLEALAKDLVAKIKAKEDDIQLAINEAYSQLAETTFKKLRRQLPITRAKMDWGKLSSYKVGDQLPS